MGTSEAMIEKHYSHLLALIKAKALAGIDHGVYEGLDGED